MFYQPGHLQSIRRLLPQAARAQATKIDGDVCYLGCPTVALWHAKHYDGPGWLLLDKGHFALTKWLDGQITRDQFLQFDVFTPLPNALRDKFAVVIADPPWYDDEYRAFWQQAQALVKPKGIIGVTYYPSTFDKAKYERFQELMRSEYALFGATEIDYEVPEFEAISSLQSEFEHPESGIYRPGYMDFYQAPAKKKQTVVTGSASRQEALRAVEVLDDVHYMRCRELVKDSSTYPLRVTVARHGLGHVTRIPGSCVGWTTRNLVVTSAKGAGREVSSLAELVSYVAERDGDRSLVAT